MKYIITEDQNERMKNYVISYLDENLTPYLGWDSAKDFKTRLRENEGELFFKLQEIGDYGSFEDDNHMWYGACYNSFISQNVDECPQITIPKSIYYGLDGLFGNLWKPIFQSWFKEHTGLPVNYIGTD